VLFRSALIIRLPLASGLLAGKFTADSTFPDQDHRHYNRDGQMFNVGETFAGLPFDKGVGITERLRPLLIDDAGDATMAQRAQRWILDHEAVTTVITGAKNVRQATDNAAASDLPRLPDVLHNTIAAFYSGEVEAHIRGVY